MLGHKTLLPTTSTRNVCKILLTKHLACNFRKSGDSLQAINEQFGHMQAPDQEPLRVSPNPLGLAKLTPTLASQGFQQLPSPGVERVYRALHW